MMAPSTTTTTTHQGLSEAEFARRSNVLRQAAFVSINTSLRDKSTDPHIPEPVLLEHIHDYRNQHRLLFSLYGADPTDIPYCDLVGFGSNESQQMTAQVILDQGTLRDEDGQEIDDTGACRPQRLAASTFFQNVKTVAAGGMTSFAVTTTGRIFSWGNADDGGLGRVAKSDEDQGTPQEITGFYTTTTPSQNGSKSTASASICEDGSIVDVVAGAGHVLILTLGGNLYSCGFYKDSDSLITRDGRSADDIHGSTDGPVHVPLPGKVIMFTTKGSFNAVVLENGSLYTWGTLQ